MSLAVFVMGSSAGSTRPSPAVGLTAGSGVTGFRPGEEGDVFSSSVKGRADASRWFAASMIVNFLLGEMGEINCWRCCVVVFLS